MTIANALPLFDDIDRSRQGALGRSATWFETASRLDREDCIAIRTTLESWYSRFPDPTSDLRSRLRANDQNSLSAFFEIFLHELFMKSGLDVTAGPEITTGSKPDFLIAGANGRSVYVEATVTRGDVDDVHAQQVLGAINDLDGEVPENIGVHAVTYGSLNATPRLRSVKGRVRQWLNGLDAEDLGGADVTAAPRLTIPPPDVSGDWRLTLHAVKRDGGRVIQASQHDVQPYGKSIRDALAGKAGQHRAAGWPVLLAVNDVNRYFDEERIFSRFWAAHPKIAAALIFDRCVPWGDADDWAVHLEANPTLEGRLPPELRRLADSTVTSVRERWTCRPAGPIPNERLQPGGSRIPSTRAALWTACGRPPWERGTSALD